MTLKEHGGSPAGRTGSSQGSPPAGDPPRGGVSPHGGLRAGRGGPREACNYLSMATGRWGRPLGNLLGTTWEGSTPRDDALASLGSPLARVHSAPPPARTR